MNVLITGVTGQDGSYLAEYLVLREYDVYGLVRRSASPNHWRIAHLLDKPNFHLVDGDLIDLPSLMKILSQITPKRIYNLAAQSFVGVSWGQPYLTILVTGIGAINVFEAVGLTGIDTRIFQASSSEMFGKNFPGQPINLTSYIHARSPYAAAKILAHQAAHLYRDQGMYISCGVSFNHESPRRGIKFVTRKITWEGSRVIKGLQEKVVFGNILAMRDWGYAPDFVHGFYLTLEQKEARDYLFATGGTQRVKDFIEVAQEHLGQFSYETKESEKRPIDVNWLCGDSSETTRELNWQPRVCFDELVKIMAEADKARSRVDEMTDAWVMKNYL